MSTLYIHTDIKTSKHTISLIHLVKQNTALKHCSDSIHVCIYGEGYLFCKLLFLWTYRELSRQCNREASELKYSGSARRSGRVFGLSLRCAYISVACVSVSSRMNTVYSPCWFQTFWHLCSWEFSAQRQRRDTDSQDLREEY
jgi:hypothetical protein